jgi:hypothetical protein
VGCIILAELYIDLRVEHGHILHVIVLGGNLLTAVKELRRSFHT